MAGNSIKVARLIAILDSGVPGVEARTAGIATVSASAEELHQNIKVPDPRP
jgi:hypothetical protein